MLNTLKAVDSASETAFRAIGTVARFAFGEFKRHPISTPILVIGGSLALKVAHDALTHEPLISSQIGSPGSAEPGFEAATESIGSQTEVTDMVEALNQQPRLLNQELPVGDFDQWFNLGAVATAISIGEVVAYER